MLGLLTRLLHLTHERPECGGKNLLRNVATYLPLNTAPNTRTLESSAYEDSGRRYSVTWQAVRVATFQESNFRHRQIREKSTRIQAKTSVVFVAYIKC